MFLYSSNNNNPSLSSYPTIYMIQKISLEFELLNKLQVTHDVFYLSYL
jgi:hypothetical protein